MAPTIRSASHLFALAHGSDCVGPERCMLCGAACDGSRPAADLAKPGSFTGWSGAAEPASGSACEGCALAARESATVPLIDGTVKEQSVGAIRTYSWVVTRDRAVAAHKGHLAELRAVCLSPPDPPYAVVLSDSGKIHLIYRVPACLDADVATVSLDGEPIVYRPDALAFALDVAGRIASACGKPALKRPAVTVGMAAAVASRFRGGDVWTGRWESIVGSPLGRLAAWLCPNMEECKIAYPGDYE